MSKSPTGIHEWAAISEIVASIAVVASLAFVGISINRQTDQMQIDNVNDLFDSVRQIELSMLTDPNLLQVVVLSQQGSYDTLTPSQAFQYDRFMTAHIDILSQAFHRFRDGEQSVEQFEAWDSYYVFFVNEWLPRESWERIREVYPQPFRDHVEAMYGSGR